jgi:hypothetical protein
LNNHKEIIMKLIRTTLGVALAGLSLTGCFFDDNAEKHPGGSAVIITDPPAIALFGAENHAFNNADVELEYNVLKIGLDTSGGTLRLPVSGVVVGDTFPYIWIANSGEGTISKLDVRTGQELGRYRTAPVTAIRPAPRWTRTATSGWATAATTPSPKSG